MNTLLHAATVARATEPGRDSVVDGADSPGSGRARARIRTTDREEWNEVQEKNLLKRIRETNDDESSPRNGMNAATKRRTAAIQEQRNLNQAETMVNQVEKARNDNAPDELMGQAINELIHATRNNEELCLNRISQLESEGMDGEEAIRMKKIVQEWPPLSMELNWYACPHLPFVPCHYGSFPLLLLLSTLRK